MPSIFIDANILLGFWSLQEGRLPTDLILPLVDLKKDILLTQQVVDEVNRNKLNVFLASTTPDSKGLPPEIPTHMITSKEANSLNEEIRSLRSAAKKSKKTWNDWRLKAAKAISSGEDITSGLLAPLLKAAVSPTVEQLTRARDRRERGNPPGKRADPLGDQISWEQFLDAANGQKKVWIVTRDGDFTYKVDEVRMLNPLLQAELTARGVRNVTICDNLSSALNSIRKAGLQVAIQLDNVKLGQLAKEEAEAHYPHPPYLGWPDTSWKCPKCHAINAGGGLSAHPSQYGGWSYWAHCKSCGYRWDTGEPYDD